MMKVAHLLNQEAEGKRRAFVAMAAISGLANAALLAIINAAAQADANDEIKTRYLFLFAVALVLFVIAQRHIFDRGTAIFEELVERLRARLLAKLRDSDLQVFEQVGSAEIYTKLTQQTAVVSNSAGSVVAAFQSALMVGFVGMYIAILSRAAFMMTVALVVGGVLIYLKREKETRASLQETTRKETEFFGVVTHEVDGFKELKMSARRSTDLMNRLEALSAELREANLKTNRLFNANYIFAQCFFYTLIAAVVFLLPRFIPTYTLVLTEITAAILFIIGPLSAAVGGIPALSKANIAAEQIALVEEELERHRNGPSEVRTSADSDSVQVPPVPPELEAGDAFARPPVIGLEGVQFTYKDKEGLPLFSLGPIDLEIAPGEILFISGGNGSGKSTLAKVITALYRPDSGTLSFDGVPVVGANAQSYREFFSVILSDFHLFDRFYGLDPDPAVVDRLLRQMGIKTKTEFVDGRFTKLDLSTGQRKRLAMIMALLEERPILVFDEWAAEQDAGFRRYFYEDLLTGLKEEGRTVIAITHDDRHFHVADRVVQMEFGRILDSQEAK